MIEYSIAFSGNSAFVQRVPLLNPNKAEVYSFFLFEDINSDLGILRLTTSSAEYNLITPSGEYSGTYGTVELTDDITLLLSFHFWLVVPESALQQNFSFSWIAQAANSYIFNGYFYLPILQYGNLSDVELAAGYEYQKLPLPAQFKKNYILNLSGNWETTSPFDLNEGFWIFRKQVPSYSGANIVEFMPVDGVPFRWKLLNMVTLPGNIWYTKIKVNDIEQVSSSSSEVETISIPSSVYENDGAILRIQQSKNRFAIFEPYDIAEIIIDNAGNDVLLPPEPSITVTTERGGFVTVEVQQILTPYVHIQKIIIAQEIFTSPARQILRFTSSSKFPQNANVEIKYQTIRKDGTI
jgi:hypothetical protein